MDEITLEVQSRAKRLAGASLSLAIIGWIIYLLQWCFDLSLGLIVAVITAGSSALCSTALDVLPFLLWLIGVVFGHTALGQIRKTGATGAGRAVWGLVLNYFGLFFTLIFIIIIVVLIATGVETGWFSRFIPFLHK